MHVNATCPPPLQGFRTYRVIGLIRLSGGAEAMNSLYLFVQFLALLQPLVLSPYAVRADPKVDQCLALGTISLIANCLNPFTVSHSYLSQQHLYN